MCVDFEMQIQTVLPPRDVSEAVERRRRCIVARGGGNCIAIQLL